MAELFTSGHIVDGILLALGLEVAVLIGYRHRSGRGLRAPELLSTTAAGASLLLALRAALVDAGWPWVAGCLMLGLAAHLVDLSLRANQASR